MTGAKVPNYFAAAPVRLRHLIWIFVGAICIGLFAASVPSKDLVIIACVSAFLLSGVLIYIAQGKMLILTPASLFFSFYSVLLLPGSLVIYSREGNLLLAACGTVSILCYSVGVFVVSTMLGFSPRKEFRSFINQPWQDHWRSRYSCAAIGSLVAVALILASVYFYKFGVPILSENVEAARLAAINNSSYLFPGFRLLLLFAVTIVMIKARIYGSRWRILELLLLPTTLLLFLGSGFRAPIAALLIYFLLVGQFCKGFLDRHRLLLLLAAFVVIFGFVTWRRYSYGLAGRTILDLPYFVLKAIEHRVFLNNALNLQSVLGFFCESHKPLWGASYIMDLKAIGPGPDIAFGGWLTSRMNPDLAGVVGMTPTVVGEFYANAGLAGVVSGMLGLGAFAQYLYIGFIRRRKSVGCVVLLVFLTVNLAWIVTQGIGVFLFSKLAPILVVWVLLEMAARTTLGDLRDEALTCRTP